VCQRLYIASRTRLKTVRKTKAAPFLAVEEVNENARPRDRFGPDREFLYLAGGHVECGCGFPATPAEPAAREARVDPADLQSMQALAEHLREACRRHSTIELYLCWVHEESEPPLTRRTVSLPDLREATFRLRHRGIRGMRTVDRRQRDGGGTHGLLPLQTGPQHHPDQRHGAGLPEGRARRSSRPKGASEVVESLSVVRGTDLLTAVLKVQRGTKRLHQRTAAAEQLDAADEAGAMASAWRRLRS
jgi:hypothetical protein